MKGGEGRGEGEDRSLPTVPFTNVGLEAILVDKTKTIISILASSVPLQTRWGSFAFFFFWSGGRGKKNLSAPTSVFGLIACDLPKTETLSSSKSKQNFPDT